jgi:orotate phosphoribosyltransferase
VSGVPLGGLLLATTYSLVSRVPMLYAHPADAGRNGAQVIEGAYEPNERVLLIDDLITTGGSVQATAALLRSEGLDVRNVMVLIDRGEGAAGRLRPLGISLTSVLTLESMLNYYLSTGKVDEHLHRKCLDFIQAKRAEYEAS